MGMEIPERPRILPRGVPFIGFPFGLLRKFPVSVPSVNPAVIKPGESTTITIKSLKSDTTYTLYFFAFGLNYFMLVDVVEAATDSAGTLTYTYTPPADIIQDLLFLVPIVEGKAYEGGPLVATVMFFYMYTAVSLGK